MLKSSSCPELYVASRRDTNQICDTNTEKFPIRGWILIYLMRIGLRLGIWDPIVRN